MAEIIKPGVRIVDNRGVPEGKPCLLKYVVPPPDATIAQADVLLQDCQREARDAGVVWFRVTQPLIGTFKVEGWDHKPEGA
jgi:hypothetical protein